jgi:hypothetical protein
MLSCLGLLSMALDLFGDAGSAAAPTAVFAVSE